MINHAVILAVGTPNHNSRLTYNRAHAMLPALGKPLIIRIMNRLYDIGIREYTVIVGENEGAVASYLNTQWVPDAKVKFSLLFGNDSLLKLFQDIARGYRKPFLVCSYNCFTHINFPDSLIKQFYAYPDELIFGATSSNLSSGGSLTNALMDGPRLTGITTEASTLRLINFAICGQNIVNFLRNFPNWQQPAEYSWQFMDIARQYLESGGKAKVAETSWALQVETDQDLLKLNKYLLDESHDAHILSELPYTVRVIPPVRIDPQVSVGQGTNLGPHVYLERGCSVGHNVNLSNTIVVRDAIVESGQTIHNAIVTKRGLIK